MNFIDTHFHLDLWKDPKSLFQTIEQNRIYTIAVTNTPSVFRYTYDLVKTSKYIRPALGLHPELIGERSHELSLFKKYINQTRYIGEIGMDFSSNNTSDDNLQRKVFSEIIDLCRESGNKILTIHSRKAESEIVKIIGGDFPGKVIMHWYSGGMKDLDKAIEAGFYFSINQKMTISKNGKQIINKIPMDKLLTESDGPFIYQNDIPFSPLLMSSVVKSLATLKGKSLNDMKLLIYNNFKKLLSEPITYSSPTTL